jgi:hypothetical protein
MCKLFKFPGLYGILSGACLFIVTWLIAWCRQKGDVQHDAQGEKGTFEKLLPIYLDIAKFVIGLTSGSIVLLVGSATFHAEGLLSPASIASPLFLLALSTVSGIFFMVFTTISYESSRHTGKHYPRGTYSINLAFGYTCLLCFAFGYAWLVVIVTGT